MAKLADRNNAVPLQLHLRKLDDLDLVVALRDGCHDALATLFERYSPLVFHIARIIVKDLGEAEETVQQVFFDLYRAISQFKPERGTFRNWLLQFAYHRSINRRQHLLAKKFYNSEDLDEVMRSESFSSSVGPQHMSPPETSRFIDQMLGALSTKQRRVIELTYFEGFTAEEIAEKVGETAAVVRHDLYRGLSQLRRLLLEAGGVGEQARSRREGELEGILVANPRTL